MTHTHDKDDTIIWLIAASLARQNMRRMNPDSLAMLSFDEQLELQADITHEKHMLAASIYYTCRDHPVLMDDASHAHTYEMALGEYSHAH